MKNLPQRKITARSDQADYLKGVLILLVCIGHSIQFFIYVNRGFWEDPLFKAIYIFHMPLFMAVAGYLTQPGLTKATSITKYVRKRWILYLIPILSWATLYEMAFLFSGRINLYALPSSIIDYATGSLWFLWALLGSITIVSISEAAGKYMIHTLIVAFFFVMLLPDTGILPLFKYVLPFFVIGYFFRQLDFNYNPRRLTEVLLFFALTIASIALYSYWDKETYIYISKMALTPQNFGNIVYRWATGLVVSCCFLIASTRIYPTLPRSLKSFLSSMGSDSIYIYIMQGLIFDVVFRVAIHYNVTQTIHWYSYVLAILLGLAVACVCQSAGRVLSRNGTCSLLFFGKLKTSQGNR